MPCPSLGAIAGEHVRIAIASCRTCARWTVASSTGEVLEELTRNGVVSGCPLDNMAMEVSHHDPDMREGLDAVFAMWHEALSAKFTADIEQKRASGINPKGLATLVIAVYSGAMAMRRLTRMLARLSTAARNWPHCSRASMLRVDRERPRSTYRRLSTKCPARRGRKGLDGRIT